LIGVILLGVPLLVPLGFCFDFFFGQSSVLVGVKTGVDRAATAGRGLSVVLDPVATSIVATAAVATAVGGVFDVLVLARRRRCCCDAGERQYAAEH
jgi:hypothetical protein